MDWIHTLVKEHKAVSLGGNGYPFQFTAEAKYLQDPILEGPPEAKDVWSGGADDILMPGWAGRTVKDLKGLIACDPDERLLIVAFDES